MRIQYGSARLGHISDLASRVLNAFLLKALHYVGAVAYEYCWALRIDGRPIIHGPPYLNDIH